MSVHLVGTTGRPRHLAIPLAATACPGERKVTDAGLSRVLSAHCGTRFFVNSLSRLGPYGSSLSARAWERITSAQCAAVRVLVSGSH